MSEELDTHLPQQQEVNNLRGESSNQEIQYPLSAVLLMGVLGMGFVIGARDCFSLSNVCSSNHDN